MFGIKRHGYTIQTVRSEPQTLRRDSLLFMTQCEPAARLRAPQIPIFRRVCRDNAAPGPAASAWTASGERATAITKPPPPAPASLPPQMYGPIVSNSSSMNGLVQPGSMRLLSAQCSASSAPKLIQVARASGRRASPAPAGRSRRRNPDHLRVARHPAAHHGAQQVLGQALLPGVHQQQPLAKSPRPRLATAAPAAP